MNYCIPLKFSDTRRPFWSMVLQEGPRISAFIALCVMFVWMAELNRQERASAMRSESSTEVRLLLSLEDTNTGLMEVRGTTDQITYASPAASRILGYDPGELTGTPISSILPEGFRQHHASSMKAATARVLVEGHSSVSTMHCVALGKRGEPVDVVVRIFVSRNGIIAILNRFDEIRYIPMAGVSPEPQ